MEYHFASKLIDLELQIFVFQGTSFDTHVKFQVLADFFNIGTSTAYGAFAASIANNFFCSQFFWFANLTAFQNPFLMRCFLICCASYSCIASSRCILFLLRKYMRLNLKMTPGRKPASRNWSFEQLRKSSNFFALALVSLKPYSKVLICFFIWVSLMSSICLNCSRRFEENKQFSSC